MKTLLPITIVIAASLTPFALSQEVEVEEVEVAEEVEIVEGSGVPVPGADVDVIVGIAPAADLPDKKAVAADPIARHIAASRGLTKLQTLIEAADFASRLEAAGPMTFFVPTNAAFRDMSDKEFNNMLIPANKARLVKLLERHLVSGLLPAREMKAGAVMTASGERVLVVVEGKQITVGEANIGLADRAAGNGIYHMVDHFLKPIPSDDDE